MLTEKLLALRPTNAMHQLGADSPVPLFGARQLLQGLSRTSAVLWMPRLPRPSAAAGLLRAAAHQRSAVGLCLAAQETQPHMIRHQLNPADLFQAAVAAAGDVERTPAFALHVQAPPASEERDVLAVRDFFDDCLQAGFTSFGIDLTRCAPDQRAEIAAALLAPVMELELAMTVRLPVTDAPQAEPAARGARLAQTVGQLRAVGIAPDLILVPGPAELGASAWRLAAETAPLIAPSGLAWPNCAEGTKPPTDRRQVLVRAVIGEPIFHPSSADGPAIEADADRAEALTYVEAMDHLVKLRGVGSLGPVLNALAALCG